MRFIDYIALIRGRLRLVLGVIAIVAAAATLLSLVQGPRWEASVRLRVRPPAPGSAVGGVLESNRIQTDLGTEAELVTSTKVLVRALERAGHTERPEQLEDKVSVVGRGNTAVLELSVTDADPERARRLVNALASAYLEVRRSDAQAVLDAATASIQAQYAAAEARLQEAERRAAGSGAEAAQAGLERNAALADLVLLRGQLRDLSDRAAVETGFGEVIESATGAVPLRGVSTARTLVFGILLGVPVALAVVLLLDSLSDTIRSAHDAEETCGAPVIAIVPVSRAPAAGVVVDTDPLSPTADAFRTCSGNLATVLWREQARLVVFTSAERDEGKSTTVVNLAVAQAAAGVNVALVDGDLRDSELHRVLDAPRSPGLTEVLLGERPAVVVQQRSATLSFVPSGDPVDRPDLLVAGTKMGDALVALDAAIGGSDTTFVDTAPVLEAAETSSLCRVADGVVLVVHAGLTTKAAAQRAAEQIRRAGGSLLAVVVLEAATGGRQRVILRPQVAPKRPRGDDGRRHPPL